MAELVVFVTTASTDEATRIAHKVVEGRLAACANVVPDVRSIFRWEGRTAEEAEVLIILKTESARFDELCQQIKAVHSYEVPEIIALPIVHGSAEYLKWVREMTEMGGK